MTNFKQVASLEAKLDSLPEDDRSRVPLLLDLLILDGHERHEDIVFDLGLLGDPAAIRALAEAAERPPSYIVEQGPWGNLHEFQRKCAFALARIGTLESREVLERLAAHADPYLSEYGKEGLTNWPMPFVRD